MAATTVMQKTVIYTANRLLLEETRDRFPLEKFLADPDSENHGPGYAHALPSMVKARAPEIQRPAEEVGTPDWPRLGSMA
jgi:hypothetical protein